MMAHRRGRDAKVVRHRQRRRMSAGGPDGNYLAGIQQRRERTTPGSLSMSDRHTGRHERDMAVHEVPYRVVAALASAALFLGAVLAILIGRGV